MESPSSPRLRFACERCEAEVFVSLKEDPTRAECPSCGEKTQLRPGAIAEGRLAHCPVCGAEDLYIAREFPIGWGLSIVAAAAVASFYLLSRTDSLLWALAPLAAATLLDAILYRLTPPLVVCYLCRSFLSGVPTGSLAGFDSEKGLAYEFRRDKMKRL